MTATRPPRIHGRDAIVVEAACFSPVPCANSANTLSCGAGKGLARTIRLGRQPPSAFRRSSRY